MHTEIIFVKFVGALNKVNDKIACKIFFDAPTTTYDVAEVAPRSENVDKFKRRPRTPEKIIKEDDSQITFECNESISRGLALFLFGKRYFMMKHDEITNNTVERKLFQNTAVKK